MGNINGRFTDQQSLVLQAQLTVAKTTVKSDLSTVIIENDTLRSTNSYLNSQLSTNGNVANQAPTVGLTAQNAVGAARSSGQITPGGQPCYLGNTLFSLWDEMDIPFDELYENQAQHKFALSFDDNNNRVKGEIAQVFKRTVYEYLEVSFTDTPWVTEVVPEHRYFIPSGIYVPIKYLLGKEVVNIDNEPAEVTQLKLIRKPRGIDVYNAHIRVYENYCANGKRVHNRKEDKSTNDGEVLEI